ncbi:MAG: hypothetical protein O7B99_07110, partial [Planctomycetota bacterium]|nr:hypothetical protein [Planctomycetota bacterium]
MLAALASLLVLCACPRPAQDPEVEKLVETWPDGAVKVEREVRLLSGGIRNADGEPVNHGMYRSFHANGTQAAEGKFRDDMQVGTWRTWHANGQIASKGLYKRGLRNLKWVYLDEAGNRNGGESGDYKAIFNTYEDGTPESQGELRFNKR